MIKSICSIHDSKAAAWLSPMFFQSNGQAIRSFADAINDKNTEFGKHPEDYTVFQLGHWDERTGSIDLLEEPFSLANGINLVDTLGQMREALA